MYAFWNQRQKRLFEIVRILETIPQGCVDIGIFLKLPEESMLIVPEEYVGSCFHREVVIDFVIYGGAEMDVFICG